jgi:hypothetical protein
LRSVPHFWLRKISNCQGWDFALVAMFIVAPDGTNARSDLPDVALSRVTSVIFATSIFEVDSSIGVFNLES